MLETIQWIIISIILILSVIFFSNAILALIERNNKDIKYYPNWILVLSGFGIFISIILLPLLFLSFKDLQNKSNNIPKYEVVQTPLYKKIN